jgi:MtN3 and saliva related transmembrane protein
MHFTVWTIIGIIAALLTSFSFVPQVRKMWQHRSAKDVSHVTMFQLMAGCALWLVYGISRQDPVIIGANVVAIGTLLVGLALYYRYNGRAD